MAKASYMLDRSQHSVGIEDLLSSSTSSFVCSPHTSTEEEHYQQFQLLAITPDGIYIPAYINRLAAKFWISPFWFENPSESVKKVFEECRERFDEIFGELMKLEK
jgi:hypothetical protein